MGVREILLYPDETLSRNDNAELDTADPTVDQVLQDLADTLDASPGVALAAPQIGHAVRAIIVDVTKDRKPERREGHGRVLMLNPIITQTSDAYPVREGCLSVPEYTGNVTRYRQAVVKGYVPGSGIRALHCEGFEALAFQHEVDHLNGALFLDQAKSARRNLFRRAQ
ncbi:MAG: peptide deformylase [Dehalococcoidia bacterium]|nr:peptide deformylase [Dehalococcoidia bacterium]